MSVDWDKVHKIAHSVRDFHDWMHKRYVKSYSGKDNWHKNAPDDPHLSEWCANASMLLNKHLHKAGIPSKFVTGLYRGDGHSWVRVGDKNVDITATQFNHKLPKIHITDHDHPDYEAKHEGTKGIKHVFKTWPKEQSFRRPLRNTIKKRLDYFNNPFKGAIPESKMSATKDFLFEMKLLRSIIPQTKNYKKIKKQRLSDKKHNSDYTGKRVGWMDSIRITAHKIKKQQTEKH